MHWSVKPNQLFRLALGSFIEEYNNKVQIISLNINPGYPGYNSMKTKSNGEAYDFNVRCTFEHPYPTTKLAWIPDRHGQRPDLLATSGDYLRIWKVNPTADPNQDSVEMLALLNDSLQGNNEYCAPLTSFDWNEVDPNILGTSSIDTTCTIWDIETNSALWHSTPSGKPINPTGKAKTKLIAHDKEVYDIAFSSGPNGHQTFATVGNDGSVRLFDLRSLEHSTIIYESDFMPKENLTSSDHFTQQGSSHMNPNMPDRQQHRPLLRLAWNKMDPHYIATMPLNSTEIVILDTRYPCTPLTRLNDHRACVTDLAWAPHSYCHICTAGDDSQALIWDISQQNHDNNRGLCNKDEPILAYTAKGEINKVHWSQTQTDWIAICFDQH